MPVEPRYRWYHVIGAIVSILFCIELGLYLLIVPWTDYWESNFFAAFGPEWHRYWSNPYVRGAISGIGVLNLYIGILETLRLRRFASKPVSPPD